MNSEKLFINKRYLPNLDSSYTLYFSRNGILKKCSNSPLIRKITREEDLWYALSDLPTELQNKLKDMAISLEEIGKNPKSKNKENIFDSEDVLIYVNEETPILPIVGNFLPSDGINAYTVATVNGKPRLKPILICWDCHWSDLFTGQTKYGINVFCLASDLNDEQREIFLDEIITLENVPTYLKQYEEKTPEF